MHLLVLRAKHMPVPGGPSPPHVHAYMNSCQYIHPYLHVNTCIHAHAQNTHQTRTKRAHAHTHYVHIHVYMHTHTHRQTRTRVCARQSVIQICQAELDACIGICCSVARECASACALRQSYDCVCVRVCACVCVRE